MTPSRGLRLRPLLTASSHINSVPSHAGPFSLLNRNASGLIVRDTTASSFRSRGSSLRSLVPTTSLSRATTTTTATTIRYASSSNLKQTPLYKAHTDAKAKMGPFAGFSMPLEYPDQSHPESHKWTRENASLFDVSHMVQHKLSGPLAEEYLMTITPTSIDKIAKHSSTLSCLLTDEGGIVDDTVITRIGRDSFYFVTNAGCRDTDLPYLEKTMGDFLTEKGATDDQITWHILDHHALVALQGPKAVEVLQPLIFRDPEESDTSDTDLSTMSFGQARWLQLALPDETNTPSLLISRTGYTGEDGFEISIPPENGDSSELAMSISKAFIGDGSVVRWAGLAARDSLRLEAGMCLYGHDIDTNITPPIAALGWLVGKSRRDPNATPKFKGSEVILHHLETPKSMKTRRVGFTIEKGPAAREGAEIVNPEKPDEVIGKVTSGCPSPTLGGANIAMGYVFNGWHKRGTAVGVKVRNKVRKAEVTKMPFVENKFYKV